MQWTALFMVALGIGLWGLLQLIAAGIILLLVAFIVWFLDVVFQGGEDTQ